MEFFRRPTSIDFMGQRRLTMYISATVMVVVFLALAVRGLQFGIDFTGGTLVEIGFSQGMELAPVRASLENGGFGDAVVQHFGSTRDVLIRLAPREGVSEAELSNQLLALLRADIDIGLELRRVEFVGPQVGQELVEDGGLAMLIAMFGIVVYVWLRFEWKFAVSAIIATIHDVVFTLGVFSLAGFEFDLTVLAALLAVIGYSLNDTIVVFDRIRENFRRMRKGTSIDVINAAVNQTLSRTLMTAVSTLLVLFALLLVGGKLLFGFSLALIVGVLVGTYSSIYVASLSALLLGVSKADLMPVKKEGGELDARP